MNWVRTLLILCLVEIALPRAFGAQAPAHRHALLGALANHPRTVSLEQFGDLYGRYLREMRERIGATAAAAVLRGEPGESDADLYRDGLAQLAAYARRYDPRALEKLLSSIRGGLEARQEAAPREREAARAESRILSFDLIPNLSFAYRVPPATQAFWISENGRHAFRYAATGQFDVLDATTHEVIRRIKLPSHLQEPQQSFRLPDQAFEIGFGVPDRLDSVRTVDGARTPIFEFPKSLPWKVQNALISGKSKIIASSDGNRIAILVPAADHLLVYDRRTSKLKSTPAGGIGPGHFRFSADGDAIAGMEQSERIKIWKTADLESPPETVELTRYFGPKVTSWMTFYLDFQIQGDRITFVKKLPGGDEADVSPPAAATVSRADGSVLANTPLPDRLKGQNAEHIHLALDGRLVVIVTERHKELVFIDTATGRSAVGNLPPDTEIAYNNQALLSEDSRHLTILALEKAKTQEILLDFDLLQVESQIRGAQ